MKTEKKKQKEIAKGRKKPKKRELITPETYKLLEKKKPISKQQIECVVELLREGIRPQNISEEAKVTTRQIKHIRFILRKGSDQDIEDMLSLKYYFSSIRRKIRQFKELYRFVNRPLFENDVGIDEDDE